MERPSSRLVELDGHGDDPGHAPHRRSLSCGSAAATMGLAAVASGALAAGLRQAAVTTRSCLPFQPHRSCSGVGDRSRARPVERVRGVGEHSSFGASTFPSVHCWSSASAPVGGEGCGSPGVWFVPKSNTGARTESLATDGMAGGSCGSLAGGGASTIPAASGSFRKSSACPGGGPKKLSASNSVPEPEALACPGAHRRRRRAGRFGDSAPCSWCFRLSRQKELPPCNCGISSCRSWRTSNEGT